MCGRYRLVRPWREIYDLYKLTDNQPALNLPARYNVAPSQQVPVIRQRDGKRYMDQLRWGLLPAWAKDEKLAYKCINARAETVAEKPAFRSAFKKRRCLVVADGHYEWTIDTETKKRIPWMFRIGDDESYAMAGLWEEWKNPAGEVVTTTAIITTEPNELCTIVHDRMPVILAPSEYDTWLNPETPADQLTPLLDTYPADTMRCDRVSTKLNNARNEGADLMVAE